MIRQLFANAGGVPETGRTTGAAPFSLALHVVAIGAVLLFAQQKAISKEGPPPRIVFHAEATAAPTSTPEVVKVVLNAQPRGANQHPPAPPQHPAPSEPTATPFVAPQEVPAVVRPEEGLQPGQPLAPYEPTGCPDCTGSGTPSVGNSREGTGEPALIRVDDETGVQAPHRIHDVQPRYPDMYRVAHIEGVVHIECVIAPDGHVRDARAIDGNAVFVASALDAVRQWVYTPSKYNGRPVSVVMTVTVRFRIKY
jgi:TonB family protein